MVRSVPMCRIVTACLERRRGLRTTQRTSTISLLRYDDASASAFISLRCPRQDGAAKVRWFRPFTTRRRRRLFVPAYYNSARLKQLYCVRSDSFTLRSIRLLTRWRKAKRCRPGPPTRNLYMGLVKMMHLLGETRRSSRPICWESSNKIQAASAI